jgi:hypothetical protein
MTHGDMTKVTCGLTNTLRPVPANSTMTVAIRPLHSEPLPGHSECNRDFSPTCGWTDSRRVYFIGLARCEYPELRSGVAVRRTTSAFVPSITSMTFVT